MFIRDRVGYEMFRCCGWGMRLDEIVANEGCLRIHLLCNLCFSRVTKHWVLDSNVFTDFHEKDIPAMPIFPRFYKFPQY
jgi:hypothetical protein